MATFAAVFVPGTAAGTNLSVNATTATAEQVLSNNQLFSISSTQDITINFGTSGMGAPSATVGFRIPANVVATFDLGKAWDRFRVFNMAASAATVTYLPLSRM